MSNRITIIVDNRARMRASELQQSTLDTISALFTHTNPQHFKLKKLGFKAWNEPAVINTWSYDVDDNGVEWFSVPRGGMRRLRFALAENHVEWTVLDQRVSGDLALADWRDPLPPHQVQLWDHQERIVAGIIKSQNCLIRSSTGCLAGNTMIGINRASKGWSCRLDHLVAMHNGGKTSGRIWDPSIPTFVRSRMRDGSIRLRKLIAAYESGIEEVFELTLSSGNTLLATKDHCFLTVEGWKPLEKLTRSDWVYIEVSKRPRKQNRKPSKPWYLLKLATYHSYAGRTNLKCYRGKKKGTVPFHRLVMEAALNGISTDEFIRRCVSGNVEGLLFLNPARWVVHHIDGDSKNNNINNLMILTPAQHLLMHRADSLANLKIECDAAHVVSIKSRGAMPTYDLELEDPHNFIANGIVVHNSGKTTALLAAVSRVQLPTLIVVWERGLLRQWQERIERELGLAGNDVGLIGSGSFRVRPITLAMQQSLTRLNATRSDLVHRAFGFLGADEVNRFAAATFRKVIDAFPAKYRVGMSAEEKRKDGKEFLIYDEFGAVGADVGSDELVEAGIVHDVEVRIVPSEFRADWYVQQRDVGTVPEFARLLDELGNDEARNKLVAAVISLATASDRQALVFTHRVEHARRLDQICAGMGIRSGVMVGMDPATYEATVAGLRAGTTRVGIGTFGKIGLGLDLPAVAAGVIASPCHNNRPLWIQVTGRMSRTAEGKTDAVMWYVWDRAIYGIVPLHNLRRWSKRVFVRHGDDWLPITDYLRLGS